MDVRKNAIIIALMGRKGGITKTTTATNLAAALALNGLRTVLVDADGQANTTSIVRAKPEPGFFRLLLEDREFAEVLRPVSVEFLGQAAEFYVLPSDDSQRQVEQYDKTAPLIVQRFEELDGWADAVIVDTSPGITEVHAGFYYAADYVLLPTTLEFASVKSLASTLTYLTAAQDAGRKANYDTAQILGIIPNRFAAAEKVQQSNVGYLRGKYEQYTVFPAIRNLTVWNQAAQMRQSIYAYAPEDDYNARRQARIAANEFKPVVDAVMGLFEVVHANAG